MATVLILKDTLAILMALYPVARIMLCLADKTTESIITECQNSICAHYLLALTWCLYFTKFTTCCAVQRQMHFALGTKNIITEQNVGKKFICGCKRGRWERLTTSRSNFFHFHAGCAKTLPKIMFSYQNRGLVPPSGKSGICYCNLLVRLGRFKRNQKLERGH